MYRKLHILYTKKTPTGQAVRVFPLRSKNITDHQICNMDILAI